MPPPFLTYLTVFKSRLGAANVVLGLTGFGHQPEQALARKMRRVLEDRVELVLSEPGNSPRFAYLSEKRIVGPDTRKSGRYAGYSLQRDGGEWTARDRRGSELQALPVFQADVWLSDPAIPSTIGVPTPENARETLELAFQQRLLTKTKNTWTAAGQLVVALRGSDREGGEHTDNPFLLGLERVAFLRQIIATDGLLTRELLRLIVGCDETFRRDAIAGDFDDVVARAVEAANKLRLAPSAIREARDFLTLIRHTKRKRRPGPGAPGVLEHRVSPRLEWLTDLGYLTKEGLAKNAFEYRVGPNARSLLDDLDARFGEDRWADDVSISQWGTNSEWAPLRSRHASLESDAAFRAAYVLMERRIGPAPLPEVAFIASLTQREAKTYREVLQDLIEFAQKTEGVSLSGGRYRRTPENIHMSATALQNPDD